MNTYKQQNLNSGITLFTSPGTESDTIRFSIGVRAGSRYEVEEDNGISHLVEHMVSRNIATILRKNEWQESYILSTFDAVTNKEYTRYFFEVEKADLPIANELLLKILKPTIEHDSLAVERDIILEEIAESLDDPSSCFEDAVSTVLFGKNSLSRSVLGRPDLLRTITVDRLNEFVSKYYSSDRFVVVIDGDKNLDDIVLTLDTIEPTQEQSSSITLSRSFSWSSSKKIELFSKAEQTLVSWYFVSEKNELETTVKNTFFANMLADYLYYHIRESGLAYTLSVGVTKFTGLSILEIYSSFAAIKEERFIEEVRTKILSFRAEFDNKFLAYAKENSVKALKLEMEITGNSSTHLLNTFLQYEQASSPDQLVETIESITKIDLDNFYKEFFVEDGYLFFTKK